MRRCRVLLMIEAKRCRCAGFRVDGAAAGVSDLRHPPALSPFQQAPARAPPLALVCLPRGAGAGEQCCAGKDTADAVCGRYQSDGSDFDLNRVDTCQFSAGRTVILRRESASSTVTPQAACVRLARFGRQCNMSDEEYCRSQLARRR